MQFAKKRRLFQKNSSTRNHREKFVVKKFKKFATIIIFVTNQNFKKIKNILMRVNCETSKK